MKFNFLLLLVKVPPKNGLVGGVKPQFFTKQKLFSCIFIPTSVISARKPEHYHVFPPLLQGQQAQSKVSPRSTRSVQGQQWSANVRKDLNFRIIVGLKSN